MFPVPLWLKAIFRKRGYMATTTATPKKKLTGGSFLLEDHNLENVFTPEDFNEDQQMIAKLADEFAVNEILPNVEKIEHKDWQSAATCSRRPPTWA